MQQRLQQTIARACRRLLIRITRLGRGRAQRGPIDLDDPIGGALRDAELLVAFAAQSSRNIATEKVTELVHAAAAVSERRRTGQSPSAQQCARFWSAYDVLAVAMAPLSAHSIRSSLGVNATRSLASVFTPTGVNAWFAVVVFFVCVALQAFWVAGKELVERADLLEKQGVELQQKLLDNAVGIRRKELLVDAKVCQLAPGEQCPRLPGAVPAMLIKGSDVSRLSAVRAELELLRMDISEKDLLAQQMFLSLQSVRERGRPVETLLERWHDRAGKVCQWPYLNFLCLAELRAVGADTGAASRTAEVRQQVVAARMASEADARDGRSQLLARTLLADLEQQLSERERFERMLVEVRIIVANIGTYLIAMAMGVLGALTFILRTVSQQLREHTYVPVSTSISVVRVCLGAIAGVFGSLLVPNVDATLKTLPPMFIPFVFGYGIEILFSLLDKVVSNFAQGQPQQPARG